LAFAAGALALALAGCGFNTHGAGLGGSGGNGGSLPCNVSSQCNDQNPCTKDSCGPDKTCIFEALDGVPSPDQAAGDCKTVQCVKGEPVDKPDDNDVADDGKDCTIDSCNAGKLSHVPKPVNTECLLTGNAGTCDAQGDCKVICTTAADCVPVPANPCVTPTCDAASGHCKDPAPPVPDGTPSGLPDTKGDCKTPICSMGMAIDGPDGSDVPTTATDCDDDICTGDVPSNPKHPVNAPCNTYQGSMPGFCDGLGACKQCTDDSECASLGANDDCVHQACVNFACVVQHTPAGTATSGNPPQVAGDCQQIVCDGSGGTAQLADPTDPTSDNNQCTTDACTGQGAGMTSHTTLANGTACGTMLSCKNGTCNGCVMDSQCVKASCAGTVLTRSQTCDGMGNCNSNGTQDCAPYLCSAGNNNCTSSCNNDGDCSQGGNGNYCTGAGGQCLPKLPQGTACSAGDHQCQTGHCVDGFCCNTACGGTCAACSAALTGSANGTCTAVTTGTDPDNDCTDQGAATCGTTGLCGTGACAFYPTTQTCGPQTCKDANTQNNQRKCSGNGTCNAQTTTPCAPYVCSSTACLSTCSGDGDCNGADWCNGGACVPKGSLGASCSGPSSGNQCGSGFCVDGVCCNNACTSACQACTGSKKASGNGTGTCGGAKAGADPRGLCVMTAQSTCGTDGTCNGVGMGAGACAKWPTLTACAPATCVGSSATAGKTCDGMGACNVGGTVSTCSNSLICNPTSMTCYASCGTGGAADDAKCVSGDYCDGSVGTCKPKVAVGACTAADQCTSNICGLSGTGNCCAMSCTVGGVCGATGCASGDASCQYPNASNTCATCSGSTFTPGSCSGTGSCTTGTAGPCGGHLVCQSATACLTGCGTSDANCVSPFVCDKMGAGACKLAAGASCSSDASCASGACGTGGSGNCCAAACVTTGVCGATSCNGSGACVGPNSGTSCNACVGSTLTPGNCSGTGTCTPGTGAACAFSLICQDATSCYASCGMGAAADDAKCAAGTTCNGGSGHCN
jgi:hypothetical protein